MFFAYFKRHIVEHVFESCSRNFSRTCFWQLLYDYSLLKACDGTNGISNVFNQEIVVGKDLASLYLGALPVRSAYAEISQTNEPFIGCIRDLSIRKNSGVSANNKALMDMNLENGVLNYCPLK